MKLKSDIGHISFSRLSNNIGPGGDGLSLENPMLTAEERDMLALYQHSFDDERVDSQLILSLIHQILETSTDGNYTLRNEVWKLKLLLNCKKKIL